MEEIVGTPVGGMLGACVGFPVGATEGVCVGRLLGARVGPVISLCAVYMYVYARYNVDIHSEKCPIPPDVDLNGRAPRRAGLLRMLKRTASPSVSGR